MIDLTLPLSETTPIWPGDPAIERHPALTIEQDGVNVSHLHLGTHSGTHIDAPLHLFPHGIGVDEIPLDHLVGTCTVIDWDAPHHITAAGLEQYAFGSRVLIKTRNSQLWAAMERGEPVRFDPDYLSLNEDAAALLVERGVRLVGLDALSADPYNSHDLPAHRILLAAGVTIIEGLNLSEPEAGEWMLACLPLRLVNADGAPARVVIWKPGE